jgi:asparagine synthase (glutamine-hydrolysing)
MCGIVGGMLPRKLDAGRLDRALERLHHRGPDASGRWISPDGRWFLGHTRLSIIGLDNGEQPMVDPSGRVRMVVNGELYGYRAIRDELRAAGYAFQTDSDSEIALHLYDRDGASLAQHLRGEYAVLIADRGNDAMLAFRDRFGIKPLFYAVHEGGVYFASEIKALLALGVPARWSREAALQESYFARPHSRTLFEGIHTVPPGHYAIAQRGDVTLHPYWDLDFPLAEELARDDRSDDEVVEGFRAVLADAVRERLVADVEVASYLSGGIDSCAVLGLAQSMMDRPIRAYTLTFEDAMFDESVLAEEQARLCGSVYHPVPVTTQALADSYSDAVWHAETPFVNGHGVAKYLLSRAVRDAGIKVVFTGEGADEMLGGYAPFRRDVLLYNSEQQDPAVVERLLAEMRASNQAVPALVGSEEAPAESLDLVRRQLGFVPSWMEIFAQMGERTRTLFGKDMLEAVGEVNPYAMCLARLPVAERMRGRDPLNQGLYSWSRVHLPNFILTFLSDRMEMAHSIEGRVPFLDTQVAEYCARLPIRMKINGMREKHVLREATRDVIIDAVYDREKHPFSSPPARVSEHDALFTLYADVFSSKLLESQPIFDPAAVRATFADYQTLPPAEQNLLDGLLNRVLSMTLLHERFGMSLP